MRRARLVGLVRDLAQAVASQAPRLASWLAPDAGLAALKRVVRAAGTLKTAEARRLAAPAIEAVRGRFDAPNCRPAELVPAAALVQTLAADERRWADALDRAASGLDAELLALGRDPETAASALASADWGRGVRLAAERGAAREAGVCGLARTMGLPPPAPGRLALSRAAADGSPLAGRVGPSRDGGRP